MGRVKISMLNQINSLIRNNVISGLNAIYNWRATHTTIEGNTLTTIDTAVGTNSPTQDCLGAGTSVWDNWYEGLFPSSQYVRILNNFIDTTTNEAGPIRSADEAWGMAFGGVEDPDHNYCDDGTSWAYDNCAPNVPTDDFGPDHTVM